MDSGPINVDVHGLSVAGAKHSLNAVRFLVADLKKLLFVNCSSVAPGDPHRFCGTSDGQLLLVADGVEPNDAGQRADRHCG